MRLRPGTNSTTSEGLNVEFDTMARARTDKDLAAVSASINAGHQAATKQHAQTMDAKPCADLLRIIAERATAEGLNIETQLRAEGIERPSKTERSGKFITALQEITMHSGHPLAVVNGRVCYYNGAYWESLDTMTFRHFLTEAARALGVDQYQAIYCDFVDKASKSFHDAIWAEIAPVQGAGLLNLGNGTVVVDAEGQAELRQHEWRDGLMYVLPYDYSPEAQAPRFLAFLEQVLPFEQDRAMLQEFCGSLFSNINHEKICYLYGATGRNGKTTFKDIICAVLGAANVTNMSLSSLTDESGTGEVSRADLEGKLLNACGEADRKIKSASLLKTLASREPINVRRPYQQYSREIRNYARLMFCANDLPVFVQGAANAEARRFLFIGFDKQIPAEQVDRGLARKIIAKELPGVLLWMLEGLKRLMAQGGEFTYNPRSEYITAQFLEGSNSAIEYLRQNGLKPLTPINRQRFSRAKEYKIPQPALYGREFNDCVIISEGEGCANVPSYTTFCRDNGREKMGKTRFFEYLKREGFETVHQRDGRYFKVLRLSPEEIERENTPPGAAPEGTIWE